MKQRTLSALTLIFSICLLIFACRKEITYYVHDRTQVPSKLLESAKIWYLQHRDEGLHRKATPPPKIAPDWKDAWTVQTADSNMLMVVPTPE